mmetsp:Transcript_9614/g.16259  ORF Transcript_9614/g.16259 Transcript_9614/m.16259 type:complete len:81 (+) Transcript_9614:358-600(+)
MTPMITKVVVEDLSDAISVGLESRKSFVEDREFVDVVILFVESSVCMFIFDCFINDDIVCSDDVVCNVVVDCNFDGCTVE